MKKRKRGSSKSSKTEVLDHSTISLKLLVDIKGSRVLFAEAPKEFVDFLFHILSLPLGTLIDKFLGSNNMVGCLGKLKDSIESIQQNYFQPGVSIDDIFNPKTTFNGNTFPLLSDIDASSEDHPGATEVAVYRCPNIKRHNNSCQSVVTLCANSICPYCSGLTGYKMNLAKPKEVAETMEVDNKKAGYVKEVVTYMVMDDLVVKPMSTISSITLINKFGVKSLSQLEEKTVSFGKDGGLKLLMASLKTDKVLTSIFMH